MVVLPLVTRHGVRNGETTREDGVHQLRAEAGHDDFSDAGLESEAVPGPIRASLIRLGLA